MTADALAESGNTRAHSVTFVITVTCYTCIVTSITASTATKTQTVASAGSTAIKAVAWRTSRRTAKNLPTIYSRIATEERQVAIDELQRIGYADGASSLIIVRLLIV